MVIRFININKLLICLSLILSIDKSLSYNNKFPIIAVLTNPFPDNSDTTTQSYINFGYTSWIESSALRTVPLLFNYSEQQIDELLNKVNGVLFQGGDRNFEVGGNFESKMSYIISKTVDLKIPVWFSCQGMEYLHYYYTQNYNVLENFDAWQIALPLKIIEKAKGRSRMFKLFSHEDFRILKDNVHPPTIHYHRLGISQTAYLKSRKLRENLIITSLGYDRNGKEFIATVESSDFSKTKFFAVQFHPEAAIFTKDKDSINLSNSNAVIISQRLVEAFKIEVDKYKPVYDMTDEDEIKWGVFTASEIALKKGEENYIYDLTGFSVKAINIVEK